MDSYLSADSKAAAAGRDQKNNSTSFVMSHHLCLVLHHLWQHHVHLSLPEHLLISRDLSQHVSVPTAIQIIL